MEDSIQQEEEPWSQNALESLLSSNYQEAIDEIAERLESIRSDISKEIIEAEEAAESDDNTGIMILGFVVLAGFLSMLNVIFWALLAKRPDYGILYRIVTPIAVIGEFALIARTLIKTEAARYACLIGAIGLLIISLLSSYDYVINYHNQNQTQQNIISQTQQTISSYQGDKLVSISEQATVVSELKNTESVELKKFSTKNTLVPLASLWLLTILPIIFLERANIKKVFD